MKEEAPVRVLDHRGQNHRHILHSARSSIAIVFHRVPAARIAFYRQKALWHKEDAQALESVGLARFVLHLSQCLALRRRR